MISFGKVEALFKLSKMNENRNPNLTYHVFRKHEETIFDNLTEELTSIFKI